MAIVLLLASCAAGGVEAPRAGEPAAGEGRPALAGPAGSAAVCLEHERFVAEGAIPIDAAGPGDARQVSGLRWQAHEGCERVVIDLAAAGGGPARASGDVAAELRRDLGLVRLSLRGVERADPVATDASFGGSLASAAYAVSSPDGRWVYIDLHLAAGAEAAVSLLERPARAVVDLRPGGGPIPPAPVTGRSVVVLDPRHGDAAYPLTVTGYARTFEANVVARLERYGEVIEETFTTATGWLDAWGHYSVTFEAGPRGPVELHVGEYSARDGTWEGVVVELEMGNPPGRGSVPGTPP